MSAATPLFSPTLASVQQAFDHWRATRGKRARTPISLRRRAVALRDSYPASHICAALKINDTALKRWANQTPLPSPLVPCSQQAVLVELPAEPSVSTQADSQAHPMSSISIDLGDAVELRIDGCFTLEQILDAARAHQQGASS